VGLLLGFKVRISLGRLTLIRLIPFMRQHIGAKEQLNADLTGQDGFMHKTRRILVWFPIE
jgi:hypothetical protein